MARETKNTEERERTSVHKSLFKDILHVVIFINEIYTHFMGKLFRSRAFHEMVAGQIFMYNRIVAAFVWMESQGNNKTPPFVWLK